MMSRWQWIFKQFGQQLWVRTSLFCILAVLTALLGFFLRDIIPPEFGGFIKKEAIVTILGIIAGNMLTVATFSLSSMVAAYAAVTSTVTPRANRLLLADTTSQNALSVFLGSFLFSIVGIIALNLGIYGEGGQIVLFFATLLVIVLIVAVLVRWFNYLTWLGRMTSTIDAVEYQAQLAFADRIKSPFLGGRPMKVEHDHHARHTIVSTTVGYVRYIDMDVLNEIAGAHKTEIYIHSLPGAFLEGKSALVTTSKPLDKALHQSICDCFDIGGNRTFEQDPRFGLVVLAEIASRALSPAVNDPGTAIDITGTAIRVLTPWVTHEPTEAEVLYPHLYTPALAMDDLFDDIFTPLARDASLGSTVSVLIRLQKGLAALHEIGRPDARACAEKHSLLVYKRARDAISFDEDVDAVWRHVIKKPARRP